MQIPSEIQIGFILLTIGLFVIISLGIKKYVRHGISIISLFGFLVISTGVAGRSGIFEDFQSLPPRLPLFVAIEISMLIWLVFFSGWKDEIIRLPQWFLIGAQVFRFPLEMLLGALANANLLPIEMSFHGRNFDILSGLVAPFLALAIYKKKATFKTALIFNLVAIGLALNVVLHGILSTPYPFKPLQLSMDNFVVSLFPVTWLPLYLVPMAFWLHMVSLRKLFMERKR